MRILIMCEESQELTKWFRQYGHEAFSCDLKDCSGGHPEWHIKGDCFEAFYSSVWDMIIAHPPCTYLCVTANKWLKDQPPRKSGALVGPERRQAVKDAADFFMRIYNLPCDKICIENPVGVMSTLFREPDQIIQPMSFGHKEPKKTCLWLKGLPLIESTTKRVKAEYHTSKSGKRMPLWYAYADKSQGQAKRAEIRSKTFEGIAVAMADQWSRKRLLTLF